MIKMLTILFFSTTVLANPLFDSCRELGGTVYKSHKCPKTGIVLPINTCRFENEFGEKQFFNGCSGPSGGHKELFFPSCITHDLCYHHEPATNGYSQKKCDLLLLDNLKTVCEDKALNIMKCKRWANIMYRALRIIGKPAFHCSNSISRY
jgi:hypothetical protein